MNGNFIKALSYTLQFEGGFSDDPADSGGATNYGITQHVYDSYRTSKGEIVQSVKLLSDAEVSDVYYKLYWIKNHCDVLPDKIDTAVFDFAVNAGNEAMRELQLICNVKVDGIFGPKTMAAVLSFYETSPEVMLNTYFDAREKFYKNLADRIPKDRKFLKGWINRTEKLRSFLA